MNSSKTTLFYYNGIWWRIVLMADGTRVVRPFRTIGDARPAHPAKAA